MSDIASAPGLLTVRAAVLLSSATLRQTFGRTTSTRTALRVRLALGAAGALTVSLVLAVMARSSVGGRTLGLAPSTVLPVAVDAGAMIAVVITVAVFCGLVDDSALLRACAPLPLGKAAVLAATSLAPLLMIGFGEVVVGPAAVLGLGAFVAVPAGRLLETWASASLVGVGWGLLLSAGARRLALGLGRTRAAVYPVALALVAVVAGLVGADAVAGTGTSWVIAGPALANSAVRGHAHLLLLGAVLMFAGSVAGWARWAGDVSSTAADPAPLLRWTASGPARLFLLEVVRLWRRPRMTGAAAALLGLAAAGLAWSATVPPGSRTTVVSFCLLAFGCSVSHPFLLARGFSPRLPGQLLLDPAPVRFSVRLQLAAGTVAGPGLLTVLAMPALVLHSVDYTVFGVGVVLAGAGCGSLLGSLSPVVPGDLAREAALLFGAGATVYAALALTGKAVTSPVGLGLAVGGLGSLCLLAAAGVERTRWRSATGAPARTTPTTRKGSA